MLRRPSAPRRRCQKQQCGTGFIHVSHPKNKFGTGLEPVSSMLVIQTAKSGTPFKQGSSKLVSSQVFIHNSSNFHPKWNRVHREVHPQHFIEIQAHGDGTGFIQAFIQAFFSIQTEQGSSKQTWFSSNSSKFHPKYSSNKISSKFHPNIFIQTEQGSSGFHHRKRGSSAN